MPRKLQRRDFIKLSSLTGAALLPTTQALSKFIRNSPVGPIKFIGVALRFVNYKTLQNLEFYFINVKENISDGYIKFNDNDQKIIEEYVTGKSSEKPSFQQESYMIVRLPQQHIAEEYFLEEMDEEHPCTPCPANKQEETDCKLQFYPTDCNTSEIKSIYASTRIAGYSYLTFRINKNRIAEEYRNRFIENKNEALFEGIVISSEILMDWNNKSHFELVIRRYINQPIFEIDTDGRQIEKFKPDNVNTPSTKDQPAAENHYPLGFRSDGKDLKFNIENFPKFRSKSLDPSPITAIEAPYGLILSPELPDQYKYDFKWTFSKDEVNASSAELWMATLQVYRLDDDAIEKNIKQQQSQKSEKKLKRQEFSESQIHETHLNEGDDLMRLMIIGAPDHIKNKTENCKKISSWYLDDKCFLDKYLPKSIDRQNLVDLYILSKLRPPARTPKLSFTPLGLCGYIELKNENYDKNKIPLYEWKQLISFGRDQEVKVSTVVVEACFGLKMLYIETTKRRTKCGVSLLDYKTYLMPLETEKNYVLYNNEENITNYQTNNYKSNTPFKKITFVDTKPKLVRPLECLNPQDIVTNTQSNNCEQNRQTTLAFWAKTYKDDQYLEWEFTGTDWHNNETKFKKKLFLITSLATLEGENIAEDCKTKPTSIFHTAISLPEFTAFADIEEKLKKGEALERDKDPLDFIAFSNSVANVSFTEEQQKWVEIYTKSEQLIFQKLDLYRSFFEKKLEHIETDLRSKAGQVEDEVIEEYRKLKSKLFDRSEQIIGQIETDVVNIQLKATEIHKVIIGVSSSENQKKAKDFIEQILWEFTFFKKDIIAEIDQKLIIPEVTPYINDLKSLITEIQIKVQNISNELDTFYNSIPSKFRDLIKKWFDGNIQDVNEILCYLQVFENKCKSRIALAKDKIGYAVYRVEEELQDLKEKLQKELNEKWQQAYEDLQKKYNELNQQVSQLETEYLIFKNNLRGFIPDLKKEGEEYKGKILDFFNEYACFPQLHSAKVYIKSVNDLVHKDVPMKIKYAEDYFKNQVDDLKLNIKDNASRVFAQVHQEAREKLKGAIREIGNELGGLVNPELAADFITYLKNPVGQAKEVVKSAKDEFDQNLEELKRNIVKIEDELKEDYNKFKQDLQQKYKGLREDTLRYFENKYNEGRNNLLLITTEAKEQFKDAKRTVSQVKENAKDELDKIKTGAEAEAKAFFKGLEAKIIGSIKLQDILGVNFEPPKLDRTNRSIYYRFITNDLKNAELGPFKFLAVNDFNKPNENTKLICYFEKPLTNASNYTAWTRLEKFKVSIFDDRLVISFDNLQIASNQNTKNKVTVKIRDVEFRKELAFLQSLSKNIQIPGTGIFLNITPTGIDASFSYKIPGVSGGAFSFNNLKFMVGVTIPFPTGANGLSPLTASFGINAPDDKFVIAAGIFGGRGHFIIKTTPKYIKEIDCSLEFGGYIGLDLVIAKGEAFLMAGIRYVYSRDEMGEATMEFYAYLTCGGSVTAFGFITVSVLFMVCLRYQQYNGGSSLYGTASVSYSIKIGFFKKSFTLTFSKRLQGTDQPNTSVLSKPIIKEENEVQYAVYKEDQDNNEFVYVDYEEEYGKKKKKRKKERTFSDDQWIRYCSSFNIN